MVMFWLSDSAFECLKENSAVSESETPWLSNSLSFLLNFQKSSGGVNMVSQGSRYSNFLKSIIELQHFKWLNQPFKVPN
jgi:hypothetical protein